MCPTNNVNTLLHSVARLCKQVVSCVQWQTLDRTLPLLGLRPFPAFGAKLLTAAGFGRVRLIFCHHGRSSLLDG